MSERKKVFMNVFWKFLERIFAQGISLIVTIIIARILDPSDYSVVSLVAIFFTFANILISGGLNTALIQKKDADPEDYSTVLFVSVIISIIIYIFLFFLAPVIAKIYHQDILVLMIRIMGLALPITAIKSIWCAYISSHLMFKKFFFATLIGTIISAVVGITMALKGAGAWALVAQQMTNTIIDTIVLILSTRIHIVFKISICKLKILFKYGWKVFVSSLIGTIYTELSPLIIGVKFKAEDLSFYTKGKSFPSMLSTTATNTLSAVLFPVLSKHQDDKVKILSYTRQYMRMASFMIFPIMLGFFAISENFVLVLLTEKWLPIVYYIKIFCVCFMFDVIAIGNCETIKAIGRSDVYLIMEIIKKSCYFTILILFIVFSKSPQILVISTLVCTIIQILVNSIPNIWLIKYKLKYQLTDLLPNLITSMVMCFFVLLIELLNVLPFIKLVIQICVGIIIYIVLCILTKNRTFLYLLDLWKNYKKNKKTEEQKDE